MLFVGDLDVELQANASLKGIEANVTIPYNQFHASSKGCKATFDVVLETNKNNVTWAIKGGSMFSCKDTKITMVDSKLQPTLDKMKTILPALVRDVSNNVITLLNQKIADINTNLSHHDNYTFVVDIFNPVLPPWNLTMTRAPVLQSDEKIDLQFDGRFVAPKGTPFT